MNARIIQRLSDAIFAAVGSPPLVAAKDNVAIRQGGPDPNRPENSFTSWHSHPAGFWVRLDWQTAWTVPLHVQIDAVVVAFNPVKTPDEKGIDELGQLPPLALAGLFVCVAAASAGQLPINWPAWAKNAMQGAAAAIINARNS